jgi:hypothetical protein
VSAFTPYFNEVAYAIQNAPRLEPESKRILIKGADYEGNEFDHFTLASVVTTKTRFDGRIKKLPDINEKTLAQATTDLDFAFSELGPEGLFQAYKKALAASAAKRDTNLIRQLFVAYVGLTALGHGLTPDLAKIPNAFYKVDGFVPEVVA